MPIIEGFLFGLGTVIFFGAVFFTQLNATLENGFKAGSCLTIGVLLADLLAMLIITLGFLSFMDGSPEKFWLGLSGGIVLLIVGIWYLAKPMKISKEKKEVSKQYPKLFLQGFMINFINPFTFIYWLATISYTRIYYPNPADTFIFIIATVIGITFIYFAKVFLARQISRILQPRTLNIISRVCGFVLILMGLKLLHSIA